jgi:polyhydroxybutyrate depolymerase
MRWSVFGPAPRCPAEEREITVDGRQRQYRLFVPEAARPGMPIVLCLHGGGGNARQMERYTQFNDLAEREGFVVVYPESIGGHWNDGRGVAVIRAQRENIDDVKFLRAVLDDVAREHNVDRSRVFATGISNGAMMSHRLAAEAADVIAAIAPVVGGMPRALAEKFHPALPVSVLIIQGDADPIVPFGGGEVTVGRSKRGELLSTADTVARYVARNENPSGAISSTIDADAGDGTSVEVRRYPDGADGAKTELYVVRGGGHAWPGRSQYLPKATIGPASQDFSATQVIWSFFQGCPPRLKPAK